MSSPKIPYDSWEAIGADARTAFLENTPQSRIHEILVGVHPELRVADLDSNEWRDLTQRAYQLGISTGENMVDKIDRLRTEVSSHLDSKKVDHGVFLDPPVPNKDVLRITGQDKTFDAIVTHDAYVPDQGYNVFKVMTDLGGTLIRLVIQPEDDKDPNAYVRCITHFLTADESPYFSKYPSTYTSITYHTRVEGDDREFTFRQPLDDVGFEEILRKVYTNTEDSDNYWYIMYNVCAVFVNIVSPFTGSGRRSLPQDQDKYYRELCLSNTYPNSCFYQCIRKLRNVTGKEFLNKKQRYDKMRVMLTGDKADEPVDASLMAQGEDVFGVKFLLLGSNPPTVCLRDFDTDGTFKNTRVKYTIMYDAIYNSDVGDVVEYSENPAVFETIKSCAFLNRNGERYGIMVLEGDSHYCLVKGLRTRDFCRRCGSKHHTTDQSNKYGHARSECIDNIASVLNNDELKKWRPERHLVFYDFETVSHDRLVPYSVSWAVDDDKIEHRLGMHVEGPFVDIIKHIKGENVLIAYFGSAFDTYFLLDAAASRGIQIDSTNTVVHNNKILTTRIGRIRTWDLGQFTKCSLNSACESFGVGMAKLDYDFKEVQALYNEQGSNFLKHLDTRRTMAYNDMDVTMTRELFKVVRKALMEITGIDPLTCLTLSHLAYKMAKKDWNKRGIAVNKMPIEYDDIFSSIPGGRCEATQRGIHHGNFVLVDKNSLYPHVCLMYAFPNGDYVDTAWYQSLEEDYPIYMCECIIDQSRLRRKYAGVKTKASVDWNSNNVEVWLWGEEIEYLMARGDVAVERGRTIAWKETVKPFEALKAVLQRRIDEEAKPSPNKAISAMCKMLFNAFTGKLVQKNIDEVWAYVCSPADVHRFISKYGCCGVMRTTTNGKYIFVGKNKQKPYIQKPRHWGCRVYALSHLEMFRDLEFVEDVKYTDTDSALINIDEINKIKLGKRIGEYKVEHEAKSIAIVGRKSYCMVGDTARYRLKGYKDGQKWEIVDVASGSIVLEGNKLCPEVFEALVTSMYKVYTLQETLVKNAIKKGSGGQYEMFTIKQKNVRKELT